MKYLILFLILLHELGALPDGDSLFQQCQPEDTGVDFVHRFDLEHPRAYLYYSGTAVGGISLGDVNGDSLVDIYMAGAAGKNALWLNQGGMKFKAMELPSALVGKNTWGTGVALVDIDNDGDLDLYQCNFGTPNQLFLNDGMGRYSEVSGAAGLDVNDASLQASFADIDNDGDLDMFLLCNEYYSPSGRPVKMPITYQGGIPVVKSEFRKYYKMMLDGNGQYRLAEYGRRDYLFLNMGADEKGQLKFKDISRDSGACMEGWGLSSIWWDYDGDGDLDLYVANDFDDPDRLFRNDGVDEKGIPQFTNVIADTLPNITWSSMGSDFADINHDGLPDLIVAEMAATTHYKAKTNMGALTQERRDILTNSWPRQYMRNHLFIGTNIGFFQETAYASGLGSSNWSWTTKFGDLDNDGYQDVFFSNGISRDLMNADEDKAINDLNKARIGKTMWDLEKNSAPRPEKNLVFQNVDGKKFKKRSDWGLDLLGMSYSSAMGDLDNDGDLDLIVSDLGKKTKIYQNKGAEGNSLRVRLTGKKSNRMGIGARVVVTDAAGVKRTRWVNPWTGFQSQNDIALHFGLGKNKVRKIEVYWPSGVYQKVPVTESRIIEVVEKATGKAPGALRPKPHFALAKAPEFTHKDKEYDDFKRQPLLPWKLSQLGPCIAKGDMDGDGDEDFFVGGAQGQAGALFVNDGGRFVLSKQTAFEGLARYAEDSAAVMFDADGDGDLDLLVVTGSTEYKQDDTLYKDRLYLNTPKGGKPYLQSAPDGAFPFLLDSGSCVTTADYDGDGDQDVFIGSRSIPGKYPLIPESRLMRNDTVDGVVKFTDVTPDELKKCGMITDAVWADFDRDGDSDLAVSIDWGPVKIFQNSGGVLKDVTSAAGTSSQVGWWRSLERVDVDHDGDLDLVAGNTGINTKYGKPSEQYPVILYYGDMDGSGKPRIVEAKIQKKKDRPLPVRGRY